MALLVMGLVIGGVVGEVSLRLYAHAADTWLSESLRADPYAVLIQPHGEVGYRPRPGSEFAYANGARATINAIGYRGPEVSLDKPEGTLRIVIIGGSTTHGWGVDDRNTIDSYMREQLRTRYPHRTFEVVNLGFDGYDSRQILERLRSDGLALEPDFVIVNTGVNDVRNARYPDLQAVDPRTLLYLPELIRLRDEEQRGGPTLWTKAKHYLYIARLPGPLRSVLSGPLSAPEARPARRPHPDAKDYFERNLREIVDLHRHTPTTLLLSTEPSSLRTRYDSDDLSRRSYWVGDAETTQEYRDSLDARLEAVVNDAVAAGLRVARVPYQDLDPALFLDDAHLTAEGNAAVARAFVDAIARHLTDEPEGGGYRDSSDIGG